MVRRRSMVRFRKGARRPALARAFAESASRVLAGQSRFVSARWPEHAASCVAFTWADGCRIAGLGDSYSAVEQISWRIGLGGTAAQLVTLGDVCALVAGGVDLCGDSAAPGVTGSEYQSAAVAGQRRRSPITRCDDRPLSWTAAMQICHLC